ncbi:ATP-binding protein [Streptomyces sp. NPDC091385]|uniref:ATP-binding protein n=1 Tax=Streptomyces sp. NPDC091385 TaxID=3365997 RepID=UPI00381FC729
MRSYASGTDRTATTGRPEPGVLIGRAAETAALREGLARGRLVTVTGPAGVGKSSLATAVAACGAWGPVVRVRCPGGSGTAPGALAERVAEATGGGPLETLERGLGAGGRPTLLLLDDADAVRTECAGLVQRLLMRLPSVRVLVTSRQALGLGDERVVRLAPLEEADAVELFLARALPRTVAEYGVVARICRLVEGVPLAVELAAEQLGRGMAVEELADRLERDQCWLSAPSPALRRHRSLRSAVGAGYLLCDRAERAVWSRAAVFAGPFTEPSAAYLCSGAGIAPHEVPACLARLTATGVLRTLGEPGGVRPPRYVMTRAARDFGAERLRAAGEFKVAVTRHVLHHRRLAEIAGNLWSAGEQRQAARLVRDNEADLAALVDHALALPEPPAGQVAAALAGVVDLWFWWAVHDHAEEGRRHLARLLAHHRADDHLAARARWLAAWLSAPGDPATARELLGQVWPAAVLAGDDALIGRVSHVEGVLAWERGDTRAAADCFRQAADTVPPYAPGGPAPAVSLAALAVLRAPLTPASAQRDARRALTQPGVREDAWATALARYARAYADHHRGRTARAWHRARRALAGLDPHPAPLDTAPDMPQVRAALRSLLTEIESSAPSGVRPAVPGPRTDSPHL